MARLEQTIYSQKEQHEQLQATISTQAAAILALQHEKEQLQWRLQLEAEETSHIRQEIAGIRQQFAEETARSKRM